jgi:hypothetical protein
VRYLLQKRDQIHNLLAPHLRLDDFVWRSYL